MTRLGTLFPLLAAVLPGVLLSGCGSEGEASGTERAPVVTVEGQGHFQQGGEDGPSRAGLPAGKNMLLNGLDEPAGLLD